MAGDIEGADQPSRPSWLPPPRKKKDFSLGSFVLGLVGVAAFILFILVRYGGVGIRPGPLNACPCGGAEFLFDWLPAVIAFAAVVGALAATFGRKGRRLRRVGARLALLNVFLALAAWLIWLAWQVGHQPD